MFALVDCNNFYASCERVFRPDLNGKPIVVLSNNDGCVIARSNEAKKMGIPMGAPAFKFKNVFKENKISVFSTNFVLYGDMSKRVMSILASFVTEIEIYSIDEAFMNFDGFKYVDLQKYGEKIKKIVEKSTGIPVSIGFAKTKALSKVANRIAKKFPERTKGVYIIDTEEKRIKALKWLKVEDVWGIGRQNSKRLYNMGIENAMQFLEQSDNWVKKNMSIVGLRLKHELEGKSSLSIEKTKIKKNISVTRTFEKNYTEFEQIKERLSTFAVNLSEKLRKQNSDCNALFIFLYSNKHRKDLSQYNNSTVVKLPFPTNSSIELSKFAIDGLKQIFKKGFQYKKTGITALDITLENRKQIKIFENSDPKHKALMKVIDNINQTTGQQKIKLASQDLKRTWKMKQEKLSPCYTTRLSEIMSVKV